MSIKSFRDIYNNHVIKNEKTEYITELNNAYKSMLKKMDELFLCVKKDLNISNSSVNREDLKKIKKDTIKRLDDAYLKYSNLIPQSTVVNVKVAHIRPKYNTLKEWVKDPNNVYIGRGNIVFIDGERFPKNGSIWKNPFKVSKDKSLKKVIEEYDVFIRDELKKGNISKKDLLKLKGKKLGCWCVTKETKYTDDKKKWICHGQVILQLLKEVE